MMFVKQFGESLRRLHKPVTIRYRHVSALEAIMSRACACTLELPFFKKGDDLGTLLHQGMNNAQALVTYAEHLEEAGRLLRHLSAGIESQPITITADTHMICIEGQDEFLTPLLQDGTLQPYRDEEGWTEEEPARA
jgi:hypothetical protein